MADFIDITDWNILRWHNTGGTRSKQYVQHPESGEYYFFKESERRENKYYKYEFWSEIVAYELGACLGVDVLKYDAACLGDKVGCLSKSMHNKDVEELAELGKYLQAFNPSFKPQINSERKKYDFQLIDRTLRKANLGQYIDKVFEIIIFDCLIGNVDRHQENLAFINSFNISDKNVLKLESEIYKNRINGLKLNKLVAYFFKTLLRLYNVARYSSFEPRRFAPIYDSGSSLARELSNEKVIEFLRDENKIHQYILKGKSEIHWNKKKLTHFDFIDKLLNHEEYRYDFKKKLVNLLSKYDEQKVQKIVNEIDKVVPNNFLEYKIPEERKELIIKIINLRQEELRSKIEN